MSSSVSWLATSITLIYVVVVAGGSAIVAFISMIALVVSKAKALQVVVVSAMTALWVGIILALSPVLFVWKVWLEFQQWEKNRHQAPILPHYERI